MTGTRTLRNPALRKGPRMVNGRREVLEKDAVKVEEVVMKTEKLAVVHKVRSVPVIDFDNLEADSEDEAFGGKVVMRARSAIESDSSGYTAAASQLRRENERANEVKAGIY